MPLNRSYTREQVRRLITELEEMTENGTSREVSDITQLGDREIRYLRRKERDVIPSTYRVLQLSLWLMRAWPYLEDGEAIPDSLFWEIDAIMKSGTG